MRTGFICLMAMLGAAFPAWGDNFTGAFYAQGGPRDTPLFTQAHTEQFTGDSLTSIHRVYLDPDRKEVAVEDVTFEAGRLKTYTLDQRQNGDKGRLDVNGGKLNFSYTSGGKTSTEVEDEPPNLMIGATLVPFLRARWDALLAGEVIRARLAVLDRQETVGFQFRRIEESKSGGRTMLIVQMKPSSIIIAALVKPVRLTFEKDTRRLVQYSGRALPQRKVDGKWVPFDADTVLTYE